MIACRLAALVPRRVLSLALLNVTGGGYECIPRVRFSLQLSVIKHIVQELNGMDIPECIFALP